MTTEETDRTNEQKEAGEARGCCSPRFFTEMMANCGAGMQGECRAMMEEMLKGGCCRFESK